jgi:hypothetical protein
VPHNLIFCKTRYHIECTICHCCGPGTETLPDLDEAIMVWNTRPAGQANKD